MQTILVTGGAGFIGSNCIASLLKRGDRVICVDNFNNFYNLAIKEQNIAAYLSNPLFKLYREDITNQGAMEEIISNEMPDRILHLAARAGVQQSLRDPIEYVRSNVAGTAVIFDAAKKQGIDKIVFASSSSVYGGRTKIPFKETDSVDSPVSPYTATKKSCELLAAAHNHITNASVIALRYFTVYGPRNRPDMAIYSFAEKLSKGETITIYGRKDEIRRDWTFVDDIVAGTIAALDNAGKFGYEVINLGNERPVPVRRMVELLACELRVDPKFVYAPLPKGDVPITAADSRKANQLLGWKPYTPIEKGVKHFIKWYREHKKQFP